MEWNKIPSIWVDSFMLDCRQEGQAQQWFDFAPGIPVHASQHISLSTIWDVSYAIPEGFILFFLFLFFFVIYMASAQIHYGDIFLGVKNKMYITSSWVNW